MPIPRARGRNGHGGPELDHSRSCHEAQGGVEVLSDASGGHARVPELVGVVEVEAVGGAGRVERLVLRPEEEQVEGEVLVAEEARRGETGVHADQGVRAGALRIPVGQDPADPGLGEQVAAHPGDEQVLLVDGSIVRDLHVVGDHVQDADVESLFPADELGAGDDGNLLSPQKADPTAEEGDEVAPIARRQPGDLEDPGSLEKEGPLLRKEEREPCQVHLAVVGLRLGEVGVDGDRGVHAGGDVLEDVDADFEIVLTVLAAG